MTKETQKTESQKCRCNEGERCTCAAGCACKQCTCGKQCGK